MRVHAQEPNPDAVARRAFGGTQPRISPDGRSVALSYQGAICVMPSTGGALTYLTQGETWDVEPAWSPVGHRIAYIASHNFTTGELRVIDSVDGAKRPCPKACGPEDRSISIRTGGVSSASSVPVATKQAFLIDLDTGDFGRALTTDIPQRGAYALSHNARTIIFSAHQLPREQSGMNGPQADLWKCREGGSPEKVLRFRARIYTLGWDAEDKGSISSLTPAYPT
jgi:Tol biopolymer transport system component